MIRLHIAYANFCYWLYEVTHTPYDDGDSFAPMLDEKRAERVAGVQWIRSHAYVMHGPNRLHWDKCPECARVTT